MTLPDVCRALDRVHPVTFPDVCREPFMSLKCLDILFSTGLSWFSKAVLIWEGFQTWGFSDNLLPTNSVVKTVLQMQETWVQFLVR